MENILNSKENTNQKGGKGNFISLMVLQQQSKFLQRSGQTFYIHCLHIWTLFGFPELKNYTRYDFSDLIKQTRVQKFEIITTKILIVSTINKNWLTSDFFEQNPEIFNIFLEVKTSLED